MPKRFLKCLFSPRVVRVPDKIRVVCFSKKGKKYLKVFNTENGANICFQVESIDYANSDLSRIKNQSRQQLEFSTKPIIPVGISQQS